MGHKDWGGLNANCEGIFSMKFQRTVTFHFRGGSEKNGHYFPFSSDIELYLRSLKHLKIKILVNENIQFYNWNNDMELMSWF